MTNSRVISRLPRPLRRLLERIEPLILRRGEGVAAADGRPRLFLVVHNKNHMTIFKGFVPLLEARGVVVQLVTIGGHRNEAQARAAIKAAGRDSIDLGEMGRVATIRDLVCVGNDWGPWRLKHWLQRLRAAGVPLVGIVEGARFGFPHLYRQVDRLLCWGPSGLEIGARGAVVVGSPIIESAMRFPRVAPEQPRVLVNYKFSSTDAKEGLAWGAAAAAAARIIDPDYFFSTHPSNRVVPENVNVNHAPFPELLAQSSLVITKASTVIYEALAGGVSVLYFPAKDEVRAEFADPRGAFGVAGSASELSALAAGYAARPVFPAAEARAFLERHVSVDPEQSANERIATTLLQLLRDPVTESSAGPPSRTLR